MQRNACSYDVFNSLVRPGTDTDPLAVNAAGTYSLDMDYSQSGRLDAKVRWTEDNRLHTVASALRGPSFTESFVNAKGSSTRSTGPCTTFGERYVDQHTSGYKRSTTKDGAATHKAPLRFRDTQSLPECPQDILLQELVPYCAWNPMRLVDPDGMEINPVYGSDGTFRVVRPKALLEK